VNDEQTPPEETPDSPPAPEREAETPPTSEATRAEDHEASEPEGTQVASDADASPRESAGEPAPVADEQPEPAAEESPVLEEEAAEEVELPPRQRPEIPGADLIPDIPLVEDDEFLDAEARAAAEAEAEARAAREREQHEDVETRPIADAAIDLAAGARYTAYAINGKPLDTYFPRETLRRVIRQPLESVGYDSRMDVVARMHGGGVAAQAEALRHGISRALIVADPHLRGELKRRGFLTRDPRVKERKKAGLKKARKRPQFSKR
jgi:small subunit ribosomal protein S9